MGVILYNGYLEHNYNEKALYVEETEEFTLKKIVQIPVKSGSHRTACKRQPVLYRIN